MPVSELAPENEFDTDNLSPRVTLSYDATDTMMLYAAYAVGFKSGGLNGRATAVENFVVYDDAEITSYELGVKSDLFDSRLRLNVAAFYQELEDWQVQVNSIDPVNFTFLTRIENAAGANMTGVELEATWVVSESFQINGSLGWIDPEYDSYLSQNFTTLEFIDVADIYNFQFTPDWSGNLTARYEAQLGEFGILLARVDWSYVDSQYFQVSPSPLIEGDDYTLLDARLELKEAFGSSLSVALWGKNLGDEEYRTGGFDVPNFGINPPDGLYANSWGNTRTWGIDVRYDF